ETAALHDHIAEWCAREKPLALVDLHQDSVLPDGYAFGYVNAGPREEWAALLRRVAIPFARARLRNASWTDVRLSTDRDGLVGFRDGSLTDWAAMVGVPMSLCLEAPIAGERGAI